MRKCIGIIAVFFLCGIAGCVSITTAPYTLTADTFAPGTSLRLIHIADLHSTIHGKNQETLIQKIRQAEPDLILLTGDIIDDRAPLAGTRLLLAGVRDTAPIYYVTGNHEYWHEDFQGIMDELRSFGVTILSDAYERIEIRGNVIIIAGVEDPYRQYFCGYDPEQALRNAFTPLETLEGYKILLAHRPERIQQYKAYPFDLVLSGHAHGGQVRIPFLLNGVYAPNQGLFPRYAGGLYTHGRLTHIVSRGLSINPLLPRVFNPPELVSITVNAKE